MKARLKHVVFGHTPSSNSRQLIMADYISYLFSGVVLIGGIIGYVKVGKLFISVLNSSNGSIC